ncbi:MAG: hypothetical protein FWD28_05685 [Treponema sp.]|nr:hypothetical protein [Treponema sp.]
MATVKKFLFLFFVLTIVIPVFANEEANRVERTSDGFVLFQTITFPEVPNTLRYEVDLEQIDGSQIIPLETIITNTNSIEVSLKAGYYRYRITAINRMNLLEGISEWQEFRIIEGLEPVPISYQPHYGMFFELPDPNNVLIIYGRDFFDVSEFALVRHRANYDWSGVSLEGRNDVIFPKRVEVEGNHASLSFESGSLRRGTYQIFIRNPGGLWSTFGQVRVGYRNNTDFTFSFGYSPMIAAFDIENALFVEAQVLERQLEHLNPLGFYFRLGWIPLKTKIGNFGLELHFNLLDNNNYRNYTRHNDLTFFFDATDSIIFNVLYQVPFTERWQHNFRLGFGIMFESYHYTGEPNFNEIQDIALNFGYSAQFFVWKNLYLEAGLDIQYTFEFSHLMFRPHIGIGWQFGRWAEQAEVIEAARRGEDFSVPVTQPPKGEHLVSLSWHPMIPLSGFELIKTDGGVYIQALRNFNAGGVSLRYAYLPHRWGQNKLGIRFEFGILERINRVETSSPGYEVLDLLSQFMVGAIYQRVLSEKWQLNFHAGLGISNPYNYNTGVYEPVFATNAGASVQYFIWKDMYAEAGIDFVFLHYFEPRVSMRPSLTIGWQFNRNNETGLRLRGHGLPTSLFPPKPAEEPEHTEHIGPTEQTSPQPVILNLPEVSLGEFQLELIDNFVNAPNYQSDIQNPRLLNGHRLSRGDVYKLKVTYTASRDLENEIGVGFAGYNPWTALSWRQVGISIPNNSNGGAVLPASKAGEEVTAEIIIRIYTRAETSRPVSNAMIFTTASRDRNIGPVTLNFTEFVLTKIE